MYNLPLPREEDWVQVKDLGNLGIDIIINFDH